MYANIIEKLGENDMKTEDLMLNGALESHGINLNHKLKIEATPSANTVKHIENSILLLDVITTLPRILQDDELLNIFLEIIVLGLANQNEKIQKIATRIG